MSRIIEDEHYYDNRYIIIDDILEFERVYMVDEDKFDDETYRKLGVVYKSLPAYIGNPTYLPCWYGGEEKKVTNILYQFHLRCQDYNLGVIYC